MVDADTQQKQPAFDHTRLADALSRASRPRLLAHAAAVPDLHLQRRAERDRDDHRRRALDVHAGRLRVPHAGRAAARRDSPRHHAARCAATCPRVDAAAAHVARRQVDGVHRQLQRRRSARSAATSASTLSTDGSEGNYYDGASIAWSPDSSKLVAYRIRPGYRRLVHYVASSPEDQLQPEHWAHAVRQARRPARPRAAGAVRRRAARSRSPIDSRLFPNPYDMSDLVWRKDSRAFTFEYNQRGHQVFRVIEVDAQTGAARAVDLRRAEDVFLLQPLGRDAAGRQALSLRPRRRQGSGLDVGARRLESPLSDRRRDRRGEEPDHQGRVAGAPRDQGGRGEAAAVVQRRRHERPGKDPYFQHYYRINLDGTRPDAADQRRRQPHRRVLVGHDSSSSITTRASICASVAGAATRGRRRLSRRRGDREGRHHRAREGRLEGARGVRREGPRRHHRHLGPGVEADATSIRRRSIR